MFLQHEVPNKHLCWLILTHMEDCLCFLHTLDVLNAHLLLIAQTKDICSCQTIWNPTEQSVAQPIPHHSRKKLSFSSSGWCNRFYQEFLPLKEQINAKYINVLLLPQAYFINKTTFQIYASSQSVFSKFKMHYTFSTTQETSKDVNKEICITRKLLLSRQGRQNRDRDVPWFTKVWEMGILMISKVSENSKGLRNRETGHYWKRERERLAGAGCSEKKP